MTSGLVTSSPFNLHGSIIIVDVIIDGSDPLTFIFDSGAGGTIITAQAADALGILGDEAVSRQGAAGDAPIQLSKDHTISIGDLILDDITLGIADLDHIFRKSGLMFDGVIGWAILSEHAVNLNYDTMQIEIYNTKRYHYNLESPSFDVEVSGTSVFINANVTFETGAVFSGKVLVDTGSGGTISFNTPFAVENDLLTEISSSYQREVIAGLSTDSYEIMTTMIPSFSIGPNDFVNLPANIAITEEGALAWPGVMGILGNGILMRFNMFIDLQQNQIFLEPNQLFNNPFEVNCSGLELGLDDSLQKVIIDYIYPASPANDIGLLVGDEIVQIVGMDVTDFKLPQIRSMLNQDGQVVEIIINRGGELSSYYLKLRQLISIQNEE